MCQIVGPPCLNEVYNWSHWHGPQYLNDVIWHMCMAAVRCFKPLLELNLVTDYLLNVGQIAYLCYFGLFLMAIIVVVKVYEIRG